ncbi:MAG: Membrane-bound lytic murein transglycosylase [uncultured Cytophagales bacterium]|uniref:Membrane-bound lytic murein transglycosylase n=1 Tax=uncultured Cytophagales bacterium TaxID=158755 RepID=A0A6J4I2R3_9SPHI|nr:MAG: Membrane-bound lytic murein transglycosylase [uncultured Cytophagales bacterium]
MKALNLALFLLIFISSGAYSQSSFTSNPDSAVFLTKDIDNFWKAFDAFARDTTTNPFGKSYLAVGSKGVQGFTPNRIQSAENLLATVKRRRADYEKVRPNTLRVREKEKQCRSTFYALKYWYPEAVFPPVYFVVGAYNSGGTLNKDGLFIGAEMQSDVNNIPYMVAHELIHFQQKNLAQNPSLLQQSLMEGSADFLGELISGGNINGAANAYGKAHEERLCREFVARMDGKDYKDWLYIVSGKDDRPTDLGYWMGYQITAAYFNKAADKRQAIKEILDVKDHKAFLKQSGYLEKYWQ